MHLGGGKGGATVSCEKQLESDLTVLGLGSSSGFTELAGVASSCEKQLESDFTVLGLGSSSGLTMVMGGAHMTTSVDVAETDVVIC